MKKIFIILICLLIASPAFASKELKRLSKKIKNGELVKIKTYEAYSFYPIQEGWYKNSPSEFDALISYPEGEGPFPIVIITHSSWGPEEFTSKYMLFHKNSHKKLLKMGIGTMFIDSYSSRGQMASSAADQFTVPLWSMFMDQFFALEYLSKDPKVNIKKVGISGHSRGGMVSTLSSEKRLRDALISKDLYFAAAQPRAPDCENVSMFRNPQPIKETKTWMVLGGKDDYTLAEHCVIQGEKIKANGGDIEITVKKGWGHGFLGNWKASYQEEPQTFYNCPPYYTEDDGSWNKEQMDLMIKHGEVKSEEEFHKLFKEDKRLFLVKNWDAYYAEQCIGTGAYEGGNKWGAFRKDYFKFWKENLL